MKKKSQNSTKTLRIIINKTIFFQNKKVCECVSVNVCQILKKKEDEEIKKKDLNSNNCDIYN